MLKHLERSIYLSAAMVAIFLGLASCIPENYEKTKKSQYCSVTIYSENLYLQPGNLIVYENSLGRKKIVSNIVSALHLPVRSDPERKWTAAKAN